MRVGTASGTPDATFDPVPLPVGARGGWAPERLDSALGGWAASAPMRALAAASGWEWPAHSVTSQVLGRLAELSADWDFRASRERYLIERTPADVNGRQLPDALVLGAARALGLVEASPPPAGSEFSHLVILGGQPRACVNRAHLASELVRRGLRVNTVVALGAHRGLADTEREQAASAGLGRLDDEADVLLAATSRAFGLGVPATVEEPRTPPDPSHPAEFHGASARYRWPSAEVVIAPSDAPESRRAETGDQLRHWAGLAGLNSAENVLILTTQIYVPYQHLVAARVLGLTYGCGVYSCGVDAASSLIPGRDFGARDYLQEIRAALYAALMLLRQASEQPST